MRNITNQQENANQWDHLTPIRMAIVNNTRANKCWLNVQKKELLCTIDGNVSAAIMENSMKCPQKAKKRTTIWYSNLIPGYTSKRIEIRIS